MATLYGQREHRFLGGDDYPVEVASALPLPRPLLAKLLIDEGGSDDPPWDGGRTPGVDKGLFAPADTQARDDLVAELMGKPDFKTAWDLDQAHKTRANALLGGGALTAAAGAPTGVLAPLSIGNAIYGANVATPAANKAFPEYTPVRPWGDLLQPDRLFGSPLDQFIDQKLASLNAGQVTHRSGGGWAGEAPHSDYYGTDRPPLHYAAQGAPLYAKRTGPVFAAPPAAPPARTSWSDAIAGQDQSRPGDRSYGDRMLEDPNQDIAYQGGPDNEGFDDSVICTELYRQGLISEGVYTADSYWGRMQDYEVIAGYQLWARPLVKLMRRSYGFTLVMAALTKPWMKEVMHDLGMTKRGSRLGRLYMDVGIPVCRFLGKINAKKVRLA